MAGLFQGLMELLGILKSEESKTLAIARYRIRVSNMCSAGVHQAHL